MITEETRNAVNLHMLATREGEKQTCKNCGQEIVLWTLPQMGYFQETLAWYHVCTDPQGLRHFVQHTDNDPRPGEKKCYKPEPLDRANNQRQYYCGFGPYEEKPEPPFHVCGGR